MTVDKVNGFKAPYRSSTFQAQAGSQTERSGVLTMDGAVTQSGSVITVPPFSFIQIDRTTGEPRGLITKKDVASTVSAPASPAPFHLVVSAGSSANIDDLEFTFAKSPKDLSAADVILASYDGNEWRQADRLSVDGLLKDRDGANVDFGRVGPIGGLLTTVSGPSYSNSPGVVVDKEGLKQRLLQPELFPVVATDPDYSRVDRIVYRRPVDDPSRIGQREFILGGTYSASPATSHPQTGLFDNTKERQNAKVLIASDNTAHAFCATGYGDVFQVTYAKVSSDRTTVLVSPVALSGVTAIDPGYAVAMDGSNNIHLVFIGASSQVFYAKFGPTGTQLVAPVRIDTQSTASLHPTVAVDPASTKVFVIYQSLLGANNNQLFFTTRDLNGSLITAPKNITNNLQNFQNPNVFVTDDLWVYVAWEDTGLAKTYVQTFDDIGNALASATYLSGGTTFGVSTLVDGAKSAKVRVTDDKSVIVTFLQDKGSAVFGLSVWRDGTATQVQLLASGESFLAYDVRMDQVFDALHIDAVRSTSVDYVKLEGQSVLFTLNLGSSASSVALAKDKLGSIYHVWVRALSGSFSNYATGIVIRDIGPGTVTGASANVTLTSSQLLVNTADFTSPVPTIGDQVVISGSGAGSDAGTYLIANVETKTLNGTNDVYRITVATPFAAAAIPALTTLGAFAEPVGNQVDAVKSTAELASLAFRFDTLATDTLLSRIAMPGSLILNWLVQDQPALDSDSFLVHGANVNIDWGVTSAGKLTLAGGLKILDMVHNLDYSVADGSYTLADGQALFVTLDGSNFSPTPQILPVATVPWASPVQVLGVVKDGLFNPTSLLSAAGVGQLESGEKDVIGEDLPINTRQRLGIINDTSFEAYTSTVVIASGDTYPEAISKLDNEVAALENNNPLEQTLVAPGGTDTFTVTLSGLTWSTDNTKFDVQVWVNGRRQTPIGTNSGPLTDGTFRKLTTTSIQLDDVVGIGQKVTFRKEGTSYGGPAAPSGGKLWSDLVDANFRGPDGVFTAGLPSNRFANGYFQNITLNQLTITSGLGAITSVKTKTNGDVVPLTAGNMASLAGDGKVYTADSDSADGQREVGILLETIAPGGQGKVLTFGPNIPGVLTGLGFSPGDEIFVSETGTYTNNVAGFTGGNDTIARVGWADCADGAASATATDLIMNYQVIAAAP